MALFFVRETTLNKNQWMKADTEAKDLDRFNLQQNTGDNRNIQYEKRNGKVLLAATGWIYLELLNLFLVQTGMKYPDLTEIGKGSMITTRKALSIAWKSKTVYPLLRSPQEPDTLAYEVEKCLEITLSPHKRLQGIFVLQSL